MATYRKAIPLSLHYSFLLTIYTVSIKGVSLSQSIYSVSNSHIYVEQICGIIFFKRPSSVEKQNVFATSFQLKKLRYSAQLFNYLKSF